MPRSRTALRSAGVAIRLTLLSTVVLGIAYPLAVWSVAQVALPGPANGSLLRDAHGAVVGSAHVGQSFAASKTVSAASAARWFQSRPSVAGTGYDANASSPSNLGPNSPTLTRSIDRAKAAIAKADHVDPVTIPADAVTASGSGLDPDISPAYAYEQVARVASARGLASTAVRNLVTAHVQGRQLGFLGERTVNVLELNLALTALSAGSPSAR